MKKYEWRIVSYCKFEVFRHKKDPERMVPM